MFETPDYTTYTLEELYDAYSAVDGEKYPENFNLIKKEISKRQKGKYVCSKCGCTGYETGQLIAASNQSESIFDIESGQFTTVSCIECGYTELYKGNSKSAATFFDFLIG